MAVQNMSNDQYTKLHELPIKDTTSMGFKAWADGLAEWTTVNSIFVHRPGIETSLANLDFKTNLFNSAFNLEKAQKQHDNLRDTLEAEGISVMDSSKLVGSITAEDLKEFVQFEGRFLPEYENELLNSYIADGKQLDILLTQPIISRSKDKEIETSNTFTMNNPLGNFFYSRDPLFQTGPDSFVLSNLKYKVRRRETDVVKLLFDQLPDMTNSNPKIMYKPRKSGTIEGGEVIPSGDTILIGVETHRTNIETVYDLMENNAVGHSKIGIVVSPVKTLEEMHIDTWFNIVDKDLFVASERFLDNGVELLLYERNPETRSYNLNPEISDLKHYLTEVEQMEMISLSDKEQKDLMSNGLTIGPRTYIMIDGKPSSGKFQARLEDHDVDVIPVELDELTDGLGGAHCMTQPIERKLDSTFS